MTPKRHRGVCPSTTRATSSRAFLFLAVLGLIALTAAPPAAAQLCSLPASSVNIGGGCGFPTTPMLTVTTPVIGTTVTIALDSDFPNAPSLLFVTLGPAMPIPVPIPGGGTCVLHIDPFNFVSLEAVTDAQGDFSVSFDLPNTPLIAGLQLTFQMRVWADTGIFSGDNFSNGVFATVGCVAGAEIGDTVYCDSDNDGVQDPGEPGIGGVKVDLSCADGFTASTITDANGHYLFSGVPVGQSCTVTVDPTTTPGDKVPSSNCPTSFTVSLPAGGSFLDADFCFVNVTGGQGCTPGFWKQSQHFQFWTAPYTPSTPFSAVFENAFPGLTLLQVLEQGGGGLNALGRHIVAGLLNAAHPSVSYDFSLQGVINAFNNLYPANGGAYEPLKNMLDTFNNQGSPICD